MSFNLKEGAPLQLSRTMLLLKLHLLPLQLQDPLVQRVQASRDLVDYSTIGLATRCQCALALQ